MVLGALFLIDSPLTGMGVSLGAALGVAIPCAVIIIILMRLVLRSRHQPVLMGTQRVAGSSGIAKTNLAPRGVVLVNSEEWDALADAPPIMKGERISVLSVEGLTLHVRKIS